MPRFSTTKETLDMEMQAIVRLILTLNDKSARIVHFIPQSPGKVIVTGMSHNPLLGQKQVSRFPSTGVHATFSHNVDAVSGDQNTTQQSDIPLCLSKNGHMTEIIKIWSIIQGFSQKIVGLSAVKNSFPHLEDKYPDMNPRIDSTQVRIVTTKRYSIC